MEKESEKRYQEFISASKEADDVYHTLALKFGLSDSAMWILCTMREADRELTQSEIAEEMSMSRQTINSAIKNLEKQGYLYMAPAPGDRRNKTLSFTAKGEDFVKRTVDRMAGSGASGLCKAGSTGTGTDHGDSPEVYQIYERRSGKNLTITKERDITGGFYEDGITVYETV